MRLRLEFPGVQLGEAHGEIDVLQRRRIRIGVARAKVERDRNDAMGRHEFVAQVLGLAIGKTPGAAMNLDERRKRALPARLEHAR